MYDDSMTIVCKNKHSYNLNKKMTKTQKCNRKVHPHDNNNTQPRIEVMKA